MTYKIYPPPPGLSDLVRYFWSLEGSATPSQPFIHRTMANGCPELIFHYRGKFKELLFNGNNTTSFITGLHGQTNQYRRFMVKESFGIFGVYLFPYALDAVFNIPAIAFTNNLPELNSFLNKPGHSISQKMMETQSNEERLQIICDFLATSRNEIKYKEVVFAVKRILAAKGNLNITKLSDQIALSQRQFGRKFKEQIGFTAKSFSKIIRFNTILEHPKNTEYTLTQLAFDHGYYDQAHFIKDFKEFSGYRPSTYFSGKADEVL